jgi:hypothetical protein
MLLSIVVESLQILSFFPQRTQSGGNPTLPLKLSFCFLINNIYNSSVSVASYFAGWIVNDFTLFHFAEAGILSNPDWSPNPVKAVCFPSINTVTLSLPRICTSVLYRNTW